MVIRTKSSLFSIFEAFFVTILWSSSFVIIKFGLEDISPLLFASFRYLIASLILLSVVFSSKKHRHELSQLSRSWWLKLSLYGLIYYSLTQGFLFLGLFYLPVIFLSIVLNFTPIVVMLLSFYLLNETANWKQITFVLFSLFGAIIYFFPLSEIDISASLPFAFFILFVVLISNAFSSIYGRSLNRSQHFSTLVITAVSMSFGSIILTIYAVIVEGFPNLSLKIILFILLLAFLNTALAFSLWNHAMQRLKALEMSIINNTMIIQTTILAVLFLDEMPSLKQWIGLAIVAAGTLFFQLYSSSELPRPEGHGFNRNV